MRVRPVYAVLLPVIAAISCFSCGGIATWVPSPPHIVYPDHLFNAAAPLTIPTYDGSGQAVHPAVVEFVVPWHGYKYWMAVTPYPYSDKRLENPSIVASQDGQHWVVPPGLTNPVAYPDVSFLADPDLVYDAATDQLWVYFIQQNVSGNTQLMRSVSNDGVAWSVPKIVLVQPDYRIISPSIAHVGGKYWMWYVNAHAVGSCGTSTQVEYRTSADGVAWSAPTRAALEPAPGYRVWHIEVLHVPSRNEFWMLQAAIPEGTHCADRTELMFATSPDGNTWKTFTKVALAPGTGWDNSHIYRSTLLYETSHDLLRVWYSGRNAETRIWGIGYAEAEYSKFRNWVEP